MIFSWLRHRREAKDVMLEEAAKILDEQNQAIDLLLETLSQWQSIALQAQINMRNLAEEFLIACEQPEIDIRSDIADLIKDLSDSIAQIEEHFVT